MGFNALAGLAALKGFRESQQFQSDLAARKAQNQFVVDTRPGLADLTNARTGSEIADISEVEANRPYTSESKTIRAQRGVLDDQMALDSAQAALARNPVVQQTHDIDAGLSLFDAQVKDRNKTTNGETEDSKARTLLASQQGAEQVAPLNNAANYGKAAANATAGQVQALQGISQALGSGDSALLGRAVANAHSAITGSPLNQNAAGARMIDVGGQMALAVVDSAGQVIADIPPMPASTLTMLQKQINMGRKPDIRAVAPGATLVSTGADGVTKPVFTAPESQKSAYEKMGSLEKNARFYAASTGLPLATAVQQLSMGKDKSMSSFLAQSISDKRKSDFTGTWEPTPDWINQQKSLWQSLQNVDRDHSGGSQVVSPQGTNNAAHPTMAPYSAELRRLIGQP